MAGQPIRSVDQMSLLIPASDLSQFHKHHRQQAGSRRARSRCSIPIIQSRHRSIMMAGPASQQAAPAGRRRPPHHHHQQQQQPKGGLMGPELQLVEERLLELQFGLLSLHEEEDVEEGEVRVRVTTYQPSQPDCTTPVNRSIHQSYQRTHTHTHTHTHARARAHTGCCCCCCCCGGGGGCGCEGEGADGGVRGVVPPGALRGGGGGAGLVGTYWTTPGRVKVYICGSYIFHTMRRHLT